MVQVPIWHRHRLNRWDCLVLLFPQAQGIWVNVTPLVVIDLSAKLPVLLKIKIALIDLTLIGEQVWAS